jgi:acetolactate synthase-1/2/3 large subunit
VIVLNNQHLVMVVQWDDRFYASNRAHNYLGPIDHPEAIGQGERAIPESLYPDFVAIARGFGVQAGHVRQKSEVVDALAEMIAYPGPYVLDVVVPYQEHVLPMIPSGMTVRDIIKD